MEPRIAWDWESEIGARTLTAEKRHGPWTDYDGDEPVEKDGDYWTVVDRDTGEQMGSFGFPVQKSTCEAALDEAERFGSKWGWAVDRDATRDATTVRRPN